MAEDQRAQEIISIGFDKLTTRLSPVWLQALMLAMIGFVFPKPTAWFILIILLHIVVYVHSGFFEIGFVLHK